MADLTLQLMGPTRVELDDATIEVKPRKALALLSYLAVSGGRHARDSLATMLWPHSDQRRARHALRSRLSELNLTLGKGWIEADRESIGLRAGFWLDVTEFQRMLANKTADSQSLIAAAELYRGDFMSGFTLPDCPEFDEWQFFQSENLRRALASALERLVGILSEQSEYETAVPYARRWLALDPLHETAHRQLMLLYARAGQQTAALRQYELCRQTLEDELGIPPSAETTALYEDIQAQKVAGRKSRSRPRHNLPTQTTTFIGRETELAEIKRLLLEESGCRLLTLAGPGGIGKTRLALATVVNTLEAFPGGAYFVSLASVGEVADIVPAIAEALRLTFDSTADPQEQLLDYLRQKQLLLVIDNFEHLLDAAGWLSEILTHAPGVTLLVTSRERLNLQEEWVYEVQGLPFPTDDDQTSEVLETTEVLSLYSAVALFLQRAHQAEVSFVPTAAETADIGRICRLVEGMPLGIELAAPWIRTLSCREIAAEIERNLDFLTTSLRNVPERHRSLRVVFEQTWRRLTLPEQAALMHLSVFRGGCTREAAEQVTRATIATLSALIEKALLRRTNTGRYELHELIRQFAAAKLAESGDEIATKQNLLEFLANFAQKGEQALYGSPKQLEWLNHLDNEHANMRVAIDWGLDHDLNNAAALAAANWLYYFTRGHFHETQKKYDFFLERADQLPDDLLATVLNGRCSVALAQGDLDGLESFATQALDYYQRLGDRFGIGLSYHHLASVSQGRGDFEQTSQLVKLGTDAAGNHHWIKVILLQHVANIYEARGEFDRTAQTLRSMLSTCEQFNNGLAALYYRSSLAEIEIMRKNLTEAKKLLVRLQADAEAFGEIQITAGVKEIMGLVALASGDPEKAITHIQQCIEIQDSIAGGQDRAATLLKLGVAQTESHRFPKAREALLAGSEIALKDGRPVTLDLLEHLSRLDWLERRDPICLRNLSAAAAKRAESQMPQEFPFDDFVKQTIDQIRQAIDVHHFEVLWQDGQDLDPVRLLHDILKQEREKLIASP